jgi:hypothetical protein
VNYAQDGGLLPGRVNTLTFRIEASGTGLESLEVQPTSGIEITDADSKEIAFGAPQELLIVAVGDMIEVPFGLTRRGGQADPPVIVELRRPSDGQTLVGQAGGADPATVVAGDRYCCRWHRSTRETDASRCRVAGA